MGLQCSCPEGVADSPDLRHTDTQWEGGMYVSGAGILAVTCSGLEWPFRFAAFLLKAQK